MEKRTVTSCFILISIITLWRASSYCCLSQSPALPPPTSVVLLPFLAPAACALLNLHERDVCEERWCKSGQRNVRARSEEFPQDVVLPKRKTKKKKKNFRYSLQVLIPSESSETSCGGRIQINTCYAAPDTASCDVFWLLSVMSSFTFFSHWPLKHQNHQAVLMLQLISMKQCVRHDV